MLFCRIKFIDLPWQLTTKARVKTGIQIACIWICNKLIFLSFWASCHEHGFFIFILASHLFSISLLLIFLVNIGHSLNTCLCILWEIAVIIKLNLPAIFLPLCEVTNFRMEVGLLIYMWITRPVFSKSFPIRPSLNYFECSWDDVTLFQHHSQWIRSYLLFLIVLIFFKFSFKVF